MYPIAKAARILGVSVAHLKRRHLADPSEVPAKRIGEKWLVPVAWVDAFTAWPEETGSTP